MKFITPIVALILQTGSVLAGWGPPSAAIKLTFPSNAGELRLYAVDDTGGIREWGRNSQGWFNLGLIGGGAAKVGTVISAIEESGAIRLYYQSPDGGFKQRVFEPSRGWYDGQALP